MPTATLVKATHRGTRRSNERLVLRTVYEDGPLSRADVARATGLTRTTVSDLVEGLLDDGLVAEAGTGPSTGGKAPILLRVPADARQLIGIDVDRDRLSGVVIDLRGEVVRARDAHIGGHDGEAALRELEALVLAPDGGCRPTAGRRGCGHAGPHRHRHRHRALGRRASIGAMSPSAIAPGRRHWPAHGRGQRFTGSSHGRVGLRAP